MARKKLKMNIETCIAIGDSIRAKKGEPLIKSKNKLAAMLFKIPDVKIENRTSKNVYFKIYRYERDGFYFRNQSLISAICELLYVDEKRLITKF